MFLHRQIDLLARRQRHDAADLVAGVEGEPARNAAALDLLQRGGAERPDRAGTGNLDGTVAGGAVADEGATADGLAAGSQSAMTQPLAKC